MIADMALKVQASRHLVYHAAWWRDQGKPFSKEAAMAKLHASETAKWSAIKPFRFMAVWLHRALSGGTLMRDAKITEIYEGTSEVMRMVIIEQSVAVTRLMNNEEIAVAINGFGTTRISRSTKRIGLLISSGPRKR
jgi:alkylation response protein AidB-like acyl-CoA dehydrogenase